MIVRVILVQKRNVVGNWCGKSKLSITDKSLLRKLTHVLQQNKTKAKLTKQLQRTRNRLTNNLAFDSEDDVRSGSRNADHQKELRYFQINYHSNINIWSISISISVSTSDTSWFRQLFTVIIVTDLESPNMVRSLDWGSCDVVMWAKVPKSFSALTLSSAVT